MKIEKNIPVPTSSARSRYAFADMEVGDSVFFADEPKGSQSLPVVAARSYGSRTGRKFVSRTEGTGVRVWRAE